MLRGESRRRADKSETGHKKEEEWQGSWNEGGHNEKVREGK